MTELPPQHIQDMLYTKPGIGPCARRRLRRRLGIDSKRRHGNTRRRLRILRDMAFHRQGGRCFYCGDQMVQPSEGVGHPNMVTADHLLPRAEGGADVECNVVAACARCNIEKGDMDLAEFLQRRLACS